MVTRHRRQFRNCNCIHCQKHNNYIQSHGKSQETGMVNTLASPTNEKNGQHLPPNTQKSQNDTPSGLFCSKSSDFIEKTKDERNSFCINMNGKESYLCLSKKYLDFVQNSSSGKENKKFLSAKEDFKKSLSNFSGILYRYVPKDITSKTIKRLKCLNFSNKFHHSFYIL